MATFSKQDIIDAISKTAKENDGNPLGIARFERLTGIKPYDWSKYWARFGDAQKEAGFMPNQLQGAYGEKFLLESFIGLMRKLGKFPTYREVTVERNVNSEFPDKKTFEGLGTKAQLAKKVIEYCKGKDGYDDVREWSQSVLVSTDKGHDSDNSNEVDIAQGVGEVYLFKSGRYHKIGKTNDTVRRGRELRIQLPEKCHLIHSIKTDDPNGIEAYWHKRFEAKRKQGEWFDLSSAEVKAFKRWRRII